MAAFRRRIALLDRFDDLVDAVLEGDCDPEVASRAERQWAGYRWLLHWKDWLERRPRESSHWDWRVKLAPDSQGTRRLFSISTDRTIEGLMTLAATPQPSRVNTETKLVYVDYIEAAPWNQSKLPFRRQRRAVGKNMIAEAVIQSHQCGCGGRIGLHSLPQSEGYYRGLGFHFVFADPHYQGLAYFEYNPSADNLRRRE